MTEESFQQARKLMQKANHMRGLITAAKGDVAKWTKIEDSYREQLRPAQADGAKKMLQKALARLDKIRQQFAELRFPEDDIIVSSKPRICPICDAPMTKHEPGCLVRPSITASQKLENQIK